MNEPRIVNPQEAQVWIRAVRRDSHVITERGADDLAHTVASEPDRTRAAIVDALRRVVATDYWEPGTVDVEWLKKRADAIQNGADW